jgi:hypothetical protein
MPDALSEGTIMYSFSIWNLACDARDRAGDLATREPLRPAGDAIAALLLAAAAIEGFINEVMDFPGIRVASTELAKQIGYGRYAQASRVIHVIEKNKGQTELKYMMVSQVLSGQMFDSGSAPLQDVTTLFDLRNMIMHLKRGSQTMKLVDGKAIASEMPAKIRTLQTRGLARATPGLPWFLAIQTHEMASWACQAALNIMRATIAMLPPGYHQSIFAHMMEKSESSSEQKRP